MTRLLQAAERSDPDLYTPERHEVLTGVALRALRITGPLVSVPHLWSGEHGAFLFRAVVEARIVWLWLQKQTDPEIFERFQAYGRGRLKLMKLHFEDYIDSMESPPSELIEYVEFLDRLVNQEFDERFQDIDLSGSFAGVDTRKMAEDVGLSTEYRLIFQPMSDASHGDWSTIHRNSMQRCANPVHRWHWIPRRDRTTTIEPALPWIILEHVSAIVEAYEDTFPTPTI